MPKPLAFDPLDPEWRRDPFETYRRGREIGIVRHEGLPLQLHSVFRHADIQRVLRDWETFSSVFPRRLSDEHPDVGDESPPSMLGSDPPRHTRLRSLVSKAFTPRIVSRLEPHMREIARALVDEAVARREVDLVQALTYPLPVQIIAEIIGVPREDRAQFKEWSDQLVASLGLGLIAGPSAERLEAQQAVLDRMSAYFVPLAESRRRAPRDDLLTGLVQARYEGSSLDDQEMVAMLTLLLVAGNETTTTLIGNAVLELVAHPEAERALRDDPALIPSAVEEVLRFASPVQFDPRRVTRPVEVAGAKLDAGDLVLCWLGSANRDERVFDDPEHFDVRRERNPHLAFGFGTHYCIGANLARLEAQVAIEALLEKTSRFGLATSAALPLHPSPVFRSVTELPLRLEPAARR